MFSALSCAFDLSMGGAGVPAGQKILTTGAEAGATHEAQDLHH
jgi:hypothetical protein